MSRALYGTVLSALLLGAGVAAAQTVELGEAPRRFESQDISGWVYPVVPKSAKTRAEVAGLFQSVYQPGNAVPLTWTGSIAACDPGTTDAVHQQAVIARINYFRALNDLPPVTLMGQPETGRVQAAALMMSANNALSHFPPATWTCYSMAGATGAGSANIALGVQGVAAIDLYMDDAGAGNTVTGHRRWVLFPPRTAMTTGDVPGGNQPPRPANALYVFGPSGTRPATPNGIAWPPAGFVPYQNLPSRSNRWSFSFPGANFNNASVAMTGPDGAIPVAFEPLANDMGFGDNTIVFLPTGVSYAQPTADTTYTITVSGMTGANVPASVTYSVTVIDPGSTPVAPPTVDVIEYYNQVLDHYFITWIAAEIANLDAGRTPTRWTRTGSTFKAYTTPQTGAIAKASTSVICRYYIPPGLGDSHFFGRGTAECDATGAAHPTFVLEDPQFMQMFLPVAGVCPAGTIAVYRVFSNRPDANHRYMVDRAIRDQMVARGWLAEGDGPDLVVMCAPA
jgi:uncharacterized protein YkwD